VVIVVSRAEVAHELLSGVEVELNSDYSSSQVASIKADDSRGVQAGRVSAKHQSRTFEPAPRAAV
jgi:hypothetical protein